MQGDAETCKAEFLVQSQFLEAKEILIDIFSKATTNELLAAVVESRRTIGRAVGQGWAKKISEVCAHAIVHCTEFRGKAINIFATIRVQVGQREARLMESVQHRFFWCARSLVRCLSFL